MGCGKRTYYVDSEKKTYNCPVEVTLDLIGGKWKGIIIWNLIEKTLRFNEIQKSMPGISQKMLTRQLRELEKINIIHRKVYPVIPPKVEYSLTEYGNTLIPIIESLCKWGISHIKIYGRVISDNRS